MAQLPFAVLLKSSSIAIPFGHPSNLLRNGGIRLYRFAHAQALAIGMLGLEGNPAHDPRQHKDDNMNIRQITRSNVIQIWLAAVLLVVVAAIALGAAVTIGTATLLLAMCLVPPALVLKFWPSDDTFTMAESISDAKSRPDRLG
jgi:hypothetical protein